MQTTVLTIKDVLEMDNQISRVEALAESVLRIHYRDGEAYELDFKPLIARGGVMTALADPTVFAQARPVRDGRALEFPGEVDFCADALRWDGELARRGLTRADVAGAE